MFLNTSFIESSVVFLESLKFMTRIETSGVGTRIADAVRRPFNSGMTFATAFPAPVLVRIIFRGAARPRRSFL